MDSKVALYEDDFYGWVEHQSMLLREGRLAELDAFHLLEELEGLGRSERRALTSHLARLCCHWLKWQYQPARRSRSWVLSIRSARQEIELLLRDNPSLKGSLDRLFVDGYSRGRLVALNETGLADNDIPESPAFTVQEAMEDEVSWPAVD